MSKFNPFKRRPTEAVPTDPDTDAVRLPLHKYSGRIMRRIVKDATRSNTLNITLVLLVTLVMVVFIISLLQENMGSFVISLNRRDMLETGISLSETPDFTEPQSRLMSEPLGKATNITLSDLPPDLYRYDGKNNGEDYISYTFYVRNEGTKPFDYRYKLNVDSSTLGVDAAVRVAIYSNSDTPQVFAKEQADGTPEPDTVPFIAPAMVTSVTVKDFKVGMADKYTVVIWLEGNDPQCTNDLFGGAIGLSMKIDVVNKN